MKRTGKIFLLCLSAAAALLLSAAAIPDRETRLTRLQEKAQAALQQYYLDGDHWYRCYVLLQKIERWESKK